MYLRTTGVINIRYSALFRRKKPMTLRSYSPSDDDFVEHAFTNKRTLGSSKADQPVPKRTRGSSKTSKPVLSEDLKTGLSLRQILPPNQEKFPMIKIKNSPGPLYDTIQKITTDQKEAISSMGFKSLLDFEINVMPSRLGYWLLERFDAESGNLTVFGDTIHITPELIHHTLGFPMGQFAVDVREVVKKRSNEAYIEWKKQFKGVSRLYANKNLMPVIMNQIRKNDSGNLFLKNIISLFCTILSYVGTMGTLNIGVIPSLTDLEVVKQMDWCEYVLHNLKDERKNWRPGTRFYGPILPLEVIFANSLLKKPKILAFKYRKTEKLEELEEMMRRTSKSPKTDDVGEQVADVHIDDIEEHQWVDQQANDDDIQMTGTNEDIQMTGTDENTEVAEQMTGTDQTPENGNDEPSSSSIKLTQQQLSAMILEFQGEYSQFKSAEEFNHSLRNMLCLFQEMKINIDDMLRAGLEMYPGNESLLEVRDWMNRLVNRTTFESLKSEDDSSMLMITMGDDKDASEAKKASKQTDEPQTKDGSEAKVASKKTDEPQMKHGFELTDVPQTDKQTELTLTQMFMDPAFLKEYEKIERQMHMPEFPIFKTEQFENKSLALVLYENKKVSEQILDELLKKTPFLQTSSELLSENSDDNLWKRIQEETLEMKKTSQKCKNSSPQYEESPKMITPISYAPPSAEEKLRMNETVDEGFSTPLNSFNTIARKLKVPQTTKNIKEGEEDLENIREKRKTKPAESLKSPYLQRVVVMKNRVQDIERKVAETIFAARGELDFKEWNEISTGVIDMWAYIHNMAEEKRNVGSLKKLYGHTSMITAEMANMTHNPKVLTQKFNENMKNLLFLSPVYESIKDIDLALFPMMLGDDHYYVVCFNLKEPQIHILDNMDHKQSVKDRYQKKLVNLRYQFIKFLKDNGHPNYQELNSYKVGNMKMPWQTKNNFIDCGIFAMRHMETYSGKKDFDAGFVKEGAEQDQQIVDLRKKYLSKILLSDYNETKHVVESEVEEYHRLPLNEKRTLQQMSKKNIAERANDYFEREASALL
ncbi:hypothetical protein CTI12_AA041350 [Artemisia annua]|uniref:Ubiquitin-like protease family profile domain-containing protein n=1 Tax=Artemisia annua TaxID=35608 RepID=A0A2U1QDQ0_ARTAN|nr:hypothetical protein CTI12_AA041350 [Artemisia annua]